MKKFLLGECSPPDNDGPERLAIARGDRRGLFSSEGSHLKKNQDKDKHSQMQPSARRQPQAPTGRRIPKPSMKTETDTPPKKCLASPGKQPERPFSEPQSIDQVPWRDYEIPQELELLENYVPKEIRDVVQESMDEHRAIRASRLQSQAIIVRTTFETSGTTREQDKPVVAESTAMVSARSSPVASEFTARSLSSMSNVHDSDTSLGSDDDDNVSLQPPSKPFGRGAYNRSMESLRSQNSQRSDQSQRPIDTHMAPVGSKDQVKKGKTRKNRKLLRLLPGREGRTTPSLEPAKTEPTCIECTSCFDDLSHVQTVEGLPCQHKYCSPCFSQLVSTSVLNEDTFPPKCCLQEIPKQVLRRHLSPTELAVYDEKALEYTVPIGNRYYCVSPHCSRWIDTRRAKRINGSLECPHCKVRLCTVCRGPQHPSNEECPQDFGLDATLQQAARAGWRRCYSCRAMVELNHGCRHMTCRCKAQFCYTCGAKWRTCACTEVDQARREQELEAQRIQFDADALAEEEELRAAIAAVEAAERQLQEVQAAEEARLEEERQELRNRELQRLGRISVHFGTLRSILYDVRLRQKGAIEGRHEREIQGIFQTEADVKRTQSEIAGSMTEKDEAIAKNETLLKNLQRQHAASLVQTITRHRKDQDALLAAHTQREDEDADLHKVAVLEELMPAQEDERQTLKAQQAREIQKWRTRGEQDVQRLDSQMEILQIRLGEEGEKVSERVREVQKLMYAELKWFEFVSAERMTMLGDDERRMVESGSDVSSEPQAEVKGDVGTSWHRSFVRMPGATSRGVA